MQRIRYINLRGEVIDFCGEKPLILAHVDGLGRTDAAISAVQGAYQSGQTFTRMQLGARSVRVQFSLMPEENTREAMYSERVALITKLSLSRCMDAAGNMGRLIYDNDVGSWWTYAVPDGEGVTFGTRFRNYLPGGEITFKSGSAYWRAMAQSETTLEIGEGGFRIPFSFPIRFGTANFAKSVRNEGGADSPVEITIYGSGETPSIRNNTTGAEIRIDKPVASGEKLVIHTDPERLECIHVLADGKEEDAWGYLDPESAVADFVLEPGENAVEYVPDQVSSESRVVIRWNARYEGV